MQKASSFMHPSKIIKNSVALLCQEGVSKAIPLITFPLVVRALGPEMYGIAGFAVATCTFFGILASPGFTLFGVREVARAPQRSKQTVSELMGARLSFAGGSYLLLLLYTVTLAPQGWVARLQLTLAGTALLVTALDLQWLFVGHARMSIVSSAGIAGQFAYALMVLGLIRKPSDAWLLPVAVSISLLVPMLILLLRAHKDNMLTWPTFDIRNWRGFLVPCLTLGLASMMSQIYEHVDVVMLGYMRPGVELGYYVVGYKLMLISLSFLSPLGTVFLPLLAGVARSSPGQEKRYMQWMTNASLCLAIPIAVGGFILAKPITLVLLGSRYEGAVRLVRWLMLNLIPAPLASIFGARVLAQGLDRKYLASVTLGGGINVVLNLLFIPTYGAFAAIWTTIISQFVVAGMSWYYTRKLFLPRMGEPVLLSLMASAVMSAVVLEAKNSFQRLQVLLLIGEGAVVYIVVLVAAYSILSKIRLRQVGRVG
jgi:O-antigen/teichoic acid export membrane protein